MIIKFTNDNIIITQQIAINDIPIVHSTPKLFLIFFYEFIRQIIYIKKTFFLFNSKNDCSTISISKR